MPKTLAKHPGGRPTKYKPDVFKKIEQYMQMCGKEQMALPSIEGLAVYLDISKDTIYEWGKKYKEFSDAVKRIADKQKIQLMDDGMYGGKEINAAMAIFLLKVNHGMNEKPTSLTQVNVDEMKIEFVRDEV